MVAGGKKNRAKNLSLSLRNKKKIKIKIAVALEKNLGTAQARPSTAGGNGESSYGCTSAYDATHQRVLRPRISLQRTSVMRRAQYGARNGARPCGDRILLREVRSAARACADAPSSASRAEHTRPTVFLDAESPATHAQPTRRARRHTTATGSGVSTPRGDRRRRRTRQRRRCARRASWVNLAQHFGGTGSVN